MKILLGSCTQHNASQFEQTPLHKSILNNLAVERTESTLLYTGKIDAVIRTNNKQSICKHYNKVLQLAVSEEYDIAILMHDDVSMEDSDLIGKISKALESNDVVGLAGAQQIQLKKPALWHVMSNNDNWSGAVAHKTNDNRVFMTNFGPTPARCVLLDGVFLAIKVKSITDDIRFDENLKFHHYDLDFSLNCNKHKLKLTTWPIWAVHDSGGLNEVSQEFLESEKYFLDKWQKS